MTLLPSQRFNVSKYGTVVASGASIGFAHAHSFTAAVAATEQCKASKNALAALGNEYVAGYVTSSLLRSGYAERWDNMTQEQQIGCARDIVAKAPFKESSKTPDTDRTEQEHKAVRAAQKSWSMVQRAAGIAAKKGGGRAPRAGSNEPEAPPVNALFSSPKLANDNEARDYFRNALAALLATTEVNTQTGAKKEVKHVAFLVQSIIADAKAKIEKALA
jgi:hypothetical protein